MAQVVLEHAASMDSLLSDADRLDIATLLSVGQEESNDISSHRLHGVQALAVRFDETHVSTFTVHDKNESHLLFSNVFTPFVNERKEEDFVQADVKNVVELRGSDVGEADITYQIKGLRHHEMPVIGVYIDRRICLGFKYCVRVLGRQNRYQFGGSALQLTCIGQGYGKRLTFNSHHLNVNPNYFWSDTNDAGYAFSIVAIESGEEFTIWDVDERAIGRALVLEVNQRQMEISSESKDKTVTKRVIVAMKVLVKFTSRRHGMMSLINEETVNVCGQAVLKKSPHFSKAKLRCVKNVELPMHGECRFYPVSD